MKNNLEIFRNYTNTKGVKISLVVTGFSILMLVISLLGLNFDNESLSSLCLVSLIIEIIYGVIVCFKFLRNNEEYRHLIPFLFLNWFIGCFCTNVLINIFENFPVWVYLITFLFCFSNFFIYTKMRFRFVSSFAYFINGFSFLLVVYYALYLIPIAPISVIGILALGMGFYGLVPMIVLIWHSIMLINDSAQSRNNRLAFVSGFFTVIFGLLFFVVNLNAESKKWSQHSATKSFESNEDLPTYITISQNLEPNFFNEILLKEELVYVGNDDFFVFRGFDAFGSKQYNDRKTHDPFINIAYMFCEDLDISIDDRISILKSNFDKRLETEEQLWSGKDLVTRNIKEDIKVYPNERLAYTEVTMDIACEKQSWGQKEAIYSFQLPEGAVATSLSLWVNGVERKGVLTTKELAQKAYKQIVGVEARDPSLMQWKEGNRVVVRVFPISKDLPRTFKCGFTTPLKKEGDALKYQSLNIKGPNISQAETLSRIQIVGDQSFKSSKNFDFKNKYHINESTGLDSWEATFPLTKKAAPIAFEWKDKVYEIKDIERETIAFTPTDIVLDLNKNWSNDEVFDVVNNSTKKYYVYVDNHKTEINLGNYKAILPQFKTLQYSLLPLYLLEKNSLVITKCNTTSANFEELNDSSYLQKIKSGTKKNQLKVINISDEINPFWQTIKEQKYVDYYSTNREICLKLLRENKFVAFESAENTVNIEPAGIAIQEHPKDSATTNSGSNHIFRMYAFGKVLNEQVAMQQDEDSLLVNDYVFLAKEANIVTPVSSLIVLETDADYQNNGIEKNINTLGNASISNDGAVPEPHEWLMIILGLTALFFYYKRFQKQTA